MRVLLCVDGDRTERLLDDARQYIASDNTEWLAVHVIDVRGKTDLDALRRGMPGFGPLGPRQQQAVNAAGNDRAQAVLTVVEQAFGARNLRGAGLFQRTGEPGREICALAGEQHIELLVLHARRRPGPRIGPPSVGHTARFVVDHAPCPVLLLRGSAL